MSVNNDFSTLYEEYRKALAVYGRQPVYNLDDLLRIIGLFSDETKYINKCIDCREDMVFLANYVDAWNVMVFCLT